MLKLLLVAEYLARCSRYLLYKGLDEGNRCCSQEYCLDFINNDKSSHLGLV